MNCDVFTLACSGNCAHHSVTLRFTLTVYLCGPVLTLNSNHFPEHWLNFVMGMQYVFWEVRTTLLHAIYYLCDSKVTIKWLSAVGRNVVLTVRGWWLMPSTVLSTDSGGHSLQKLSVLFIYSLLFFSRPTSASTLWWNPEDRNVCRDSDYGFSNTVAHYKCKEWHKMKTAYFRKYSITCIHYVKTICVLYFSGAGHCRVYIEDHSFV